MITYGLGSGFKEEPTVGSQDLNVMEIWSLVRIVILTLKKL